MAWPSGIPVCPEGDAVVTWKPSWLLERHIAVCGAVGHLTENLLSNDSEHKMFFCFFHFISTFL